MPVEIEKCDALEVIGVVDSGNSTTTLLDAGGIFTGVTRDITNCTSLLVFVYSDVDSATDGLSIEFSSDGINWDHTEKYTITGGDAFVTIAMAEAQYFRIVYTNGAVSQTSFRLQAICKSTSLNSEITHLGVAVTDDSDALLVRAVLAAKKPNDSYVNIQATTGGNLKVSVEEVEPASDTPEFFEDTSFVTGDSPVTLDCNDALGRNATEGYIINDGAGNFTVAFSTDGAAFGDAITIKKNEVIEFEDISVDSLKITWVADSAYRVSVI